MKQYLVIAGCYWQFARWCQAKGLPTRGPGSPLYVPDGCLEMLAGVGPDRYELVQTGTWYERKDEMRLVDELRARGYWIQ